MTQSKTNISFIHFLFLAVAVFAIGICNSKYEKNQHEQYLKELDLKLTGIVTYIKISDSYNGFGIIGLNVLHSNKVEVNPPEDHVYYYAIVRNGKAELYQFGARHFHIGDTIEVDTGRLLFTERSTDGQITHSYDILLNTNEYFLAYVKKNTRL